MRQIVFFLLFIPSSFAGVLFEPHATLHASGDASLLNESYAMSAIDGGLGIGYQNNLPFFKAEMTGHFRTLESPSGTKENFIGVAYVVGAGIRFGDVLRIFAGWMPSIEMKSTADESTYSGSGFKGELSFLVYRPWMMHFFSEFKNETFDTQTTKSGVITKLEGDLSFEVSSIAIGVSFPFDFWGRQVR